MSNNGPHVSAARGSFNPSTTVSRYSSTDPMDPHHPERDRPERDQPDEDRTEHDQAEHDQAENDQAEQVHSSPNGSASSQSKPRTQRSKSAGSKKAHSGPRLQWITYRVDRGRRWQVVRSRIEFVFPDGTTCLEPLDDGEGDYGTVQVEMEPDIRGQIWRSRNRINFIGPHGLMVLYEGLSEQHIFLGPDHILFPQRQPPPAQQPQLQVFPEQLQPQVFPALPQLQFLPTHPLPVQLHHRQPPSNYLAMDCSLPGYPLLDQYSPSQPLPVQSILPQSQQQFSEEATRAQQHSANIQQLFQETVPLEMPLQPHTVPITPVRLYNGNNHSEEQLPRAGFQRGEGPLFRPQDRQLAGQQGGEGLYYTPPAPQIPFQQGNGGPAFAQAFGSSPEALISMQNQPHDVLDGQNTLDMTDAADMFFLPDGELPLPEFQIL